MASLARVVALGVAHQITARGNMGEPSFVEDGDRELHRDILGVHKRKARVEVWD